MGKIIFVCTGNTCRSPMAEYLLKEMLSEEQLNKWEILSAGIHTYPDSPGNKKMYQVLSEEGIEVEEHLSRQLTEELIQETDLILTMTEAQKKYVKQIIEEANNIRLFTLNEFTGNNGINIDDPFGQPLDVYREARNKIKKSLEKLVKIMNKPGFKIEKERNIMKIAIASDHAGVKLKEIIKTLANDKKYQFEDMGTKTDDSVDYPDFAKKVAYAVSNGEVDRGILICGTGIGMSIVANKILGIRAALCHDVVSARAAREHNNSNILTMGARIIGKDLALEIVRVWLKTGFDGGRHQKRINKIKEID